MEVRALSGAPSHGSRPDGSGIRLLSGLSAGSTPAVTANRVPQFDGRTPGSEPGGRRFDSCRDDQSRAGSPNGRGGALKTRSVVSSTLTPPTNHADVNGLPCPPFKREQAGENPAIGTTSPFSSVAEQPSRKRQTEVRFLHRAPPSEEQPCRRNARPNKDRFRRLS